MFYKITGLCSSKMARRRQTTKTCFRLQEIKQAFQLNVIYDPGLDLNLQQGGRRITIKILLGRCRNFNVDSGVDNSIT